MVCAHICGHSLDNLDRWIVGQSHFKQIYVLGSTTNHIPLKGVQIIMMLYSRFMWVFNQLFLRVLQLLMIRFTQQILCCVSKSTMKLDKNWIEKNQIFLFSYGYRKQRNVSRFLNWTHRFAQFCSAIECGVIT